LQAAAQPIDGPRHHHVELPPNGSFLQSVECRALVPALGATDAMILVDLDDLLPGAFGNLP
jgi:hypothetical protein